MPKLSAAIYRPGKEIKLINHSCKLLVVDIDGTLVNKHGEISAADREALTEVRDLGIPVALCTGRGLQASLSIINQLSLDGYHISFDGALVSRPSRGEEIYVQPISKALVRRMAEVAQEYNLDLELFTVTHYFSERETWSTDAHRQFFGVMAVAVLWGMSIFPVLFGQRDPVLGWLLLFLAVVLVLAVTRHAAVHASFTIIAWLLFLTWVLSYGFSLEAS